MKPLIIILAALQLTACAAVGQDYRPVVDTKNSPVNYEIDLRECQAYAADRPSPGDAAAFGAVIGGLLGIVLGNLNGGYKRDSLAALGAVSGGIGAAGQAAGDQRDTIKRCMQGRGYSVLY